jgi:hypothetical protein
MNLIRGALLAGRFRTHHALNTMSPDDQRNTLIVEMVKHSNKPGPHYQGMNDANLAGAAAVMVFIRAGKIRTDAELKTMSDDDQRNTLIVEINALTKLGSFLQSFSNIELVLLGLGKLPPGGLSQSSFVRGVLLAGGFRTHHDLIAMSAEDQRNTLIVEMVAHSNQPVGFYQGLNDFELAGVGAVMVFLRGAGIRDDAQLRTISADDQRNIMIVEIDGQTHLGAQLQRLRNMDLVLAGLGGEPKFPLQGPRPFRFDINSIDVRTQKADNDHSDSDWLTIIIAVGDAVTKDRPRTLISKTIHVGEVIKNGSVLRGPFRTDFFEVRDTDVVVVSFLLMNLGSSDIEEQGAQAVKITDKVVGIAGPALGAVIGLFFGQPGEGFKLGKQVAEVFHGAVGVLSDVFDFLGLHFGPANCNGEVLSDTLTFLPGEMAQAVDRPASRDYTGPQGNERCGSPPETTVHFNVRRLPGAGLIPPDF